VTIELTREAAGTLLLAAQGMLRPPAGQATKADLVAAIRQMGALQIDTIHIVARSPYLVLWSRVGNYPAGWLDELLAERQVFEQWAHEACFLPIEDYPLYRRLMLDNRGRARGWADGWLKSHPDDVARVLALIDEKSEVRSVDFVRADGVRGTWWDWKPEKRALEHLLSIGEVAVARRERFQRVYARRQTVLPDWRDEDAPSYAAVRRALAVKALRALGVATARWLPDYFRVEKEETAALLEELADAGEAVRVRIAGLDAPAYVHAESAELAERAAAGELASEVTSLLSPFDPIVWHRERAKQLFGIDYRLECYTPAEKRVYGYFCLPVLHRGRIVGRLDAKAHRAAGLFEVRSFHLEPTVEPDDRLVAEVASAVVACASWHKTPLVALRVSRPGDLFGRLASALEAAGGGTQGE